MIRLLIEAIAFIASFIAAVIVATLAGWLASLPFDGTAELVVWLVAGLVVAAAAGVALAVLAHRYGGAS